MTRWEFTNSLDPLALFVAPSDSAAQQTNQKMILSVAAVIFVSVEILCISCAAFPVWFAIFPLPRAAAFMDNRTSSVEWREGLVTLPASLATVAIQGNTRLES
jgi:hypothetical protein